MLLSLKKDGNVLLHSVCIELGKISIENGTLFVYVPNEINYETLKKQQNYVNLVETLNKLGYNLNIEIVLDKTADKKEDKALVLEKILGLAIKIID